MADGSFCCTTSVAIGQRAFNNYNGIGIHVCFSPQQPSAAAIAAWQPTPPQLQPPPMLAVVLDASMSEQCMQNAKSALSQALGQLNPQTRLLLLVVDQAVSMLDLKTNKPQCWVVHSSSTQSASVLPQIVRAADIRATPLAHCEPFLANSIASLQHHPRKQSLQHHLRTTAAALDIALFLLTASMAAWDAQHRQQHAQQQQQQQQQRGAVHQGSPEPQQHIPLHNARVMLLTSLPSSSTPGANAAAQSLRHVEQQQAQQLQQMVKAVGAKAASLDIPIDVITGSLAAPAAVLLQEAVNTSFGRLLHQPGLQPPLASNIVATAQSRFGWEGVLDIRVPAGVGVVQISGPVSTNQKLPDVAAASGRSLPVFLLGQTGQTSPATADASAAVATAASGGPASRSSSISPAAAAASGAAAAPETVASGAGPVAWSPAASGVPVVSTGTRFVAVLELLSDWKAGSSFDVEVVCEWTAADGRRVRQVANHPVQISDRATHFLQGLDVPAVVLLMAQRLIASTAAAAVPSNPNSLHHAAPPKARALEEGRLSVGMALAHVAQRLGHAHVSRRGILGFGSQQVWQLPDDLIPLALSLYQLQRSPLLNPAARDLDALSLEGCSQDDNISSVSHNYRSAPSHSSSKSDFMYGSWRLLLQQFIQTAPSAALRMVAPWLYVYDSHSSQFEVLPPLNLALEPGALAVLDCGTELIIYVGDVLQAMVEGVAVSSAGDDADQQQQLPPAVDQQTPANGTIPKAPVVSSTTSAKSTPPDMAVAAAPAVQCAHQLLHGRVPVPAIKLIQDEAGIADLMQKLVPLHEDPVALQLLLLPHLRDLTPAQHGYLLDWHRHWAGVAAQAGAGGAAAGGARLTASEGQQELSFGQWYSSFGVVLRSPGGVIEGSAAVE